jgi:hypothetical protein
MQQQQQVKRQGESVSSSLRLKKRKESMKLSTLKHLQFAQALSITAAAQLWLSSSLLAKHTC